MQESKACLKCRGWVCQDCFFAYVDPSSSSRGNVCAGGFATMCCDVVFDRVHTTGGASAIAPPIVALIAQNADVAKKRAMVVAALMNISFGVVIKFITGRH